MRFILIITILLLLPAVSLAEVLATVNGNAVGIDIELLEINGDFITYDVVIVHLNA